MAVAVRQSVPSPRCGWYLARATPLEMVLIVRTLPGYILLQCL